MSPECFDELFDLVKNVNSTFLVLFIYIYYLLLFTQDSLFSTYSTVINEGPVIEVLTVCKASI